MRICAAISVLIALCLCINPLAFCEDDKQTTTKEICFMSIPWESSFDQFLALLEEDGAIFAVNKEILGDGDDYSHSFGIGGLFPNGNYKGFQTEYYTLVSIDSSFYVAGYEVLNMTSAFYKEAQTMYSVSVELGSSTRMGDTVSTESQYHDLVGKLTELYGSPIVQERSGKGGIVGGTFETKSYSWVGIHSTAVELRWVHQTGTYQGIQDGNTITINYGKTDSDSIMAEHQQIMEDQEMKQQQEALDSVANDYSGL